MDKAFCLPTGSANGHNVAGWVDEPAAGEFKKLGVNAVVDKPFTPEKRLAMLQTIFMKEVSETRVPSGHALSRPCVPRIPIHRWRVRLVNLGV